MAVRLEMRVDMRRWALVLCFIGVMGGGCSARSLLTIELSTNDGTAVNGTPLIQITQGRDVIRTVDRTDTFIDLAAGKGTTVGVYLDGDASGAVAVKATLRPKDGCWWTGMTPGVDIRAGERTQAKVKLAVDRMNCSGPQPDGDTDAGDGGTNDGGPTLLGDGGDGTTGEPTIEECQDYCRTYRARCVDWGADEFPEQACVPVCRQWPRGVDEETDPRGNTLSCRLYFLRKTAADTDARALCSMCPLASPNSEACGGTPAPPRACFGDASADSD